MEALEKNEEGSYLECGLPPLLQESLAQLRSARRKLDSGQDYLHYDCDWCLVQSDINVAEVEGQISSAQAWYLREKYLGLSREQMI